MRGKVTLVAGLLITAVMLPATGRSEEAAEKRTIPARSYSRFEFEAETHKGYWAELGAFLEHNHITATSGVPNTHVDADLITAFARFAYGGDKWEGNLLIPYRNASGRVAPDAITPFHDLSNDGLGDIELTGRFIPLKTGLLDAGAGFNLRLPSGDLTNEDAGIPVATDPVSHTTSSVDPGLPAGEVGALPFFTAQLHVAILDVRGHIGYQVFTGHNHDGRATDRLIYGFAIILPGRDLLPYGDHFSLRNEFTNVEYSERGTPDVANYQVGFDIRVPVGNMDLILRPTGQVPISIRAADWGLGGSIVLAAPTTVAVKKVNMVGGVVVEE